MHVSLQRATFRTRSNNSLVRKLPLRRNHSRSDARHARCLGCDASGRDCDPRDCEADLSRVPWSPNIGLRPVDWSPDGEEQRVSA